MIQIGEFSRLCRVSVRTLRLYDELDLIKPARVDEFSGYRYYELDQLKRMNRILALRDIGFSLEQVKRLVDAGLQAQEVRDMLLQRRMQVHELVAANEGRLSRIDVWLSRIEEENEMSDYDVVIKRVDAQRVASLRGVVDSPPEQGPLWEKLFVELQGQGVALSGPCITLDHDEAPQETDWDIEVCQPIGSSMTPAGEVQVADLPAVESMACVVHSGPFLTISEAYAALTQWVGDNGYRVIGPAREVLLREPKAEADPERRAQGIGADQGDPTAVVEVQFPVARS